jgi:hypothetical protein
MTLETPEKTTMADMSGEKRDRNSVNTDKPASTPNTKDTKLLCSADMEPIGKEKGKEIIEIDPDSDDAKMDNGGIDFTSPTKPDIIDVDALIASGGLDKHADDDDIAPDTPRSLFDSFEKVTTDD